MTLINNYNRSSDNYVGGSVSFSIIYNIQYEFKQYKARYKKRLAMKPGITGLWQVSGRSSITDFEDVVKLDVQYIENWSFGLDLRILIQTVLVVLKHDGAQ